MHTTDEVKIRATHLRESLAARGLPIKHGQCLDVISKLEGYEDWNAYTADINVNLNRAEQFVDEMIAGDTDPETAAKYPHNIRYVWRFIFEKRQVLGVAGVYCKDGTYYVSGFNYQ